MTANTATSRAELIRMLTQHIRNAERSGVRSVSSYEQPAVSTGLEPIEEWIFSRRIPPGSLIEWLSDGEGSGATTLACLVARQAMASGGIFVVIDRQRDFYPPAAARLGIDLNRTILVRPQRRQDRLWALEQSLRCSGVAATFCRLETEESLVFRRLQLAAEQGGGLGLLRRPATARHEPSWAEVRLLVQSLPAQPGTAFRRFCIQQIHSRGILKRQTVELELCHETGHVRLAPPVLQPADRCRTNREHVADVGLGMSRVFAVCGH